MKLLAPGVGWPATSQKLFWTATNGNNNEQIVGEYYASGSVFQSGFLYDMNTGAFTTLDYPDAYMSGAFSINDFAEIVGQWDWGITYRQNQTIYYGSSFYIAPQ